MTIDEWINAQPPKPLKRLEGETDEEYQRRLCLVDQATRRGEFEHPEGDFYLDKLAPMRGRSK